MVKIDKTSWLKEIKLPSNDVKLAQFIRVNGSDRAFLIFKRGRG